MKTTRTTTVTLTLDDGEIDKLNRLLAISTLELRKTKHPAQPTIALLDFAVDLQAFLTPNSP